MLGIVFSLFLLRIEGSLILWKNEIHYYCEKNHYYCEVDFWQKVKNSYNGDVFTDSVKEWNSLLLWKNSLLLWIICKKVHCISEFVALF